MDDIFEEFIEEVEMLLFWAGPIAEIGRAHV